MAELRNQLIATARAMQPAGLNKGTSGNVSVRHGDGFYITPTGMPYDRLLADDIPLMALDGTHAGKRKPSSEWRFHRDIYAARPEAGAIIHTHSPFATSLACMEAEIGPFHYMIARFGGKTVRCADYATFGSQSLSDAMLRALEGRSACLMAHHGMTVLGPDLNKTLDLAVELETLCEQYWRVLQLGGPKLIDDAEMGRVLEKFKSYGQQ